MDLGEHPDAAALEAGDEVELPHRPRAVERTGDDAGDLVRELRVGTRTGERELPYVEVKVEVGVLDPVGVVEAQRHLGQAPAQRRKQREALRHQIADVIDLQWPAWPLGVVQNRESADVAALARGLECQELRVEAGQLAHAGSLTYCGGFAVNPAPEPVTP